MKRYIVAIESVATPDNDNFKGQNSITWYGVGEEWLANMGSHAKAMHSEQLPHPCFIREYGYKRVCDAKRNWCYKTAKADPKKYNGKYWDVISVKIIEFDTETCETKTVG